MATYRLGELTIDEAAREVTYATESGTATAVRAPSSEMENRFRPFDDLSQKLVALARQA